MRKLVTDYIMTMNKAGGFETELLCDVCHRSWTVGLHNREVRESIYLIDQLAKLFKFQCRKCEEHAPSP